MNLISHYRLEEYHHVLVHICYFEHLAVFKINEVQWIVHSKMNILSSFTHLMSFQTCGVFLAQKWKMQKHHKMIIKWSGHSWMRRLLVNNDLIWEGSSHQMTSEVYGPLCCFCLFILWFMKVSQEGLKGHEGEEMMTEHSFLGELSF